MARVNKPGRVIDRYLSADLDLPIEERTIIGIRVLCFEDWRKIMGYLRGVISDAQALSSGRQILGLAVEYVRNLQIEDANGELVEFQLEKAGGVITEESASILYPFLKEIIRMVEEAHTFRVQDAKN